ncbi:DUF3352 domain-containing protein [Iningainema tapete]|uniref:DUF3352 domain-containing protein n=1 Tax=Iningainema tapete BLCC-T55 TaxID=2748662 RepID=A0A8J6XVD7_9CYAN|nr:DUF3352 domain-containing protein [Iningainema tapete]MBD2778491.1 DUF3352 domain-containing protein [Iningainema tapete BLCC-T55]
MPESKSKFLIPAVSTALVVVGGIAAYIYLKGGPAGKIADASSSAKVVPDEALMATYISTDDSTWAKLQQFGTPSAQQLVAKGLESFNQDLLTNSNISYEKDLKPWVGGVMIAMLPTNPTQGVQDTSAKQQPNILMVVGIKDKVSALNFANKLKSQKDVSAKEIDYKGEKIIETATKGKPTYTTVLNEHLILAPQKQAVEQAIDTYKGEPSFATSSDIITKSVGLQNTVAQIYVPNYFNMVQQLIATNPQATQIPPQTLAQIKQMKSMVAGVGIDDAGVRMKAVANLDPQLVKFQYQSTNARVVSQLPSDTIALVSGKGISNWWSALVEQSKNTPELNQTLLNAREQLKTANIDLDKEVFGWMDGEFGLAAIPLNQGMLANVGFGGALIFHTSDRTTAESILTKLDAIAKNQQLSVSQRNIGGKDITEWQIPQQGALLSHGWLDKESVFVAFGGPIADTLTTPASKTLDNSDNFKAATASLQKPNSGYFYVDMEKAVSLYNRYSTAQNQSISPEASAILSSIRGLGVTVNSPNKSTSEVEMLLALKPKTAQ